MVWTGSIWLRTGTSGGLLWTRWWTFGFLEIAGNFLNGWTIAAYQEGLSSVSKEVKLFYASVRAWGKISWLKPFFSIFVTETRFGYCVTRRGEHRLNQENGENYITMIGSKNCDDSLLIQLLTFWMSSRFLILKECFGKWTLFPPSG
jgi:hypothetical protein